MIIIFLRSRRPTLDLYTRLRSEAAGGDIPHIESFEHSRPLYKNPPKLTYNINTKFKLKSFSVLLLGNTWNTQSEISPSSNKHYKMPDVIIVPLVQQSETQHSHMVPLKTYDIVILIVIVLSYERRLKSYNMEHGSELCASLKCNTMYCISDMSR